MSWATRNDEHASFAIQVGTSQRCTNSICVNVSDYKYNYDIYFTDRNLRNITYIYIAYIPRSDTYRFPDGHFAWSRGLVRDMMSKTLPIRAPATFEKAVACLEHLCRFFARHVAPGQVDLTFDFAVNDQGQAATLIGCLRCLPPPRSVAIDSVQPFSQSAALPSRETLELELEQLLPAPQSQAVSKRPTQYIRKHKKPLPAGARQSRILQISTPQPGLTKRPRKTHLLDPRKPFRFLDLPSELQDRIISKCDGIVGTAMLPLTAQDDRIVKVDGSKHDKLCCGLCQPVIAHVDVHCHCKRQNRLAYSTSCTCPRTVNPIFRVNKSIRAEALRLFWSANQFMIDRNRTRGKAFGKVAEDTCVKLEDINDFLSKASVPARSALRRVYLEVPESMKDIALAHLETLVPNHNNGRRTMIDVLKHPHHPDLQVTFCIDGKEFEVRFTRTLTAMTRSESLQALMESIFGY